MSRNPDDSTQNILLIAGVGIAGYLAWRHFSPALSAASSTATVQQQQQQNTGSATKSFPPQCSNILQDCGASGLVASAATVDANGCSHYSCVAPETPPAPSPRSTITDTMKRVFDARGARGANAPVQTASGAGSGTHTLNVDQWNYYAAQILGPSFAPIDAGQFPNRTIGDGGSMAYAQTYYAGTGNSIFQVASLVSRLEQAASGGALGPSSPAPSSRSLAGLGSYHYLKLRTM